MAKITQLESIANQLRPTELAINQYSANNGYGITNPNAISDGDEFGKGQNESGQVGSLTDINTRTDIISINKYGANNGYGVTNPNAISDGDEFGKGQKGENGTVGSMTDIQTRIATVTKNVYGENNKYPDFQ
jgi:hypothetical protein